MSEKVIISGNGKQIDTSVLMGLNTEIIYVDEISTINLDELNNQKPLSIEMFADLPYEQWCDEYYGVNLERLMPSDHNVCCTKRYKRSNKDKEYIRRKR